MGDQVLRVYTIDDSEDWDAIIQSFRDYDTYYLSGYVKAFRIHGDGEPLLFYYNDGTVKGINVVMKRNIKDDPRFSDLPDDSYYDLSTPYGYGGWLIEKNGEDPADKSIGKLFYDYERWCIKHNVVSEFVRFHPMLGNEKTVERYYDVVQLGTVVHMDLSDPEAVWGNCSSKNRNVIRKAIKNDVKVYNGRCPEIFRQFRSIYNATMDKDNAEDYYYFGDEFYESICSDLEQHAQVFWAVKDDVIIAASIMLEANGFMNYHLSGSLREYSSLAPTNLILYKAALWGCAHGIRTLYLGGGVGSGEDSLFKFKRAFYKGELNHFHIGRKIFDRDKYDELTKMRGGSIENTGFFPVYRG